MKNKFLTVFLVTISLYPLTSAFSESPHIQKPVRAKPFETMEITYKVLRQAKSAAFDMLQSGTQVLSIDFQGNRMRDEMTMTSQIGETKTKINTVQLFDGKRMYILSPNKVKKVTNLGYKSHPWDGLFKKPTKQFVAKGTIAGKVCDIYEGELMKGISERAWFWRGAPLKIVTKAGNLTSTMEAVGIKENPVLRDDLFALPHRGVPAKVH